MGLIQPILEGWVRHQWGDVWDWMSYWAGNRANPITSGITPSTDLDVKNQKLISAAEWSSGRTLVYCTEGLDSNPGWGAKEFFRGCLVLSVLC